MEIYVDADACPVTRDVIDRSRGHRVVLVHNRHHVVESDRSNVETHETGDRSDAADHYIYNHVEPGDVVVTDDLGLASLVLGKGAHVVRFRGDRPTDETIELKLILRHEAHKARQRNERTRGPSEYTPQDRDRFRRRFEELLDELSGDSKGAG